MLLVCVFNGNALCFRTDCYLGVKLICRNWLLEVLTTSLDWKTPESGTTLNTAGSPSSDSENR